MWSKEIVGTLESSRLSAFQDNDQNILNNNNYPYHKYHEKLDG